MNKAYNISDTTSNIRFLDLFTNWDIGTQQIRPQIRNLEIGTKIKIRMGAYLMNDNLKIKIEKARLELQKEASAPITGKLNEGINSDNKLIPQFYRDFLSVCNGGRYGSIDLWSNELILDNQYRVTELDGSNENWFCIGQVLYEPLVVKLDTEDIYLFYQGYENEIECRCFENFDIFLDNYVFGKKYAEIIPDAEDEEWYIFLNKLNYI